MSEPHDVVKLLLKRMESHPEEFRVGSGPERWVTHIDMIQDYGSEADKATLNAKLRDIVMGEIHEDVMNELLNGPDERRKQEEEAEYERNLSKSFALTQQQMMQQAQGSLQNAYANQLGAYNQAQAVGIGTQSPSQPLTIGAGGKELMRIKADGGVFIQPKLSSSAVNQIKQALGIKK